MPRIERALAEAYRVLKRGGRFLAWNSRASTRRCSTGSTTPIPSPPFPAIGKVVTGDGEPYRYLVESIRKFPTPERFADMIAAAGFQRADFTRLTGGVVAIHSGWKL